MTDNLFTWNQRQNRVVNASVILEEPRVVPVVRKIMSMNSSVNTVVNNYFCCANIFRL